MWRRILSTHSIKVGFSSRLLEHFRFNTRRLHPHDFRCTDPFLWLPSCTRCGQDASVAQGAGAFADAGLAHAANLRVPQSLGRDLAHAAGDASKCSCMRAENIAPRGLLENNAWLFHTWKAHNMSKWGYGKKEFGVLTVGDWWFMVL